MVQNLLSIMQANDSILNLLREERAQAVRAARRGVILQPGAIGDCVLTLPLAKLMKDCLGLGEICTDYLLKRRHLTLLTETL